MLRRHFRGGVRAWTFVPLLALAAVMIPAASPALSAAGQITPRGGATVATYAPDSTQSLTLSVPGGTQAGDVLVASIGFETSSKSQLSLAAPAGWTLASSASHGKGFGLAVYWHVFSSGETSYTWTANVSVGAAAFLAAYGGVDTTHPIDASAGQGSVKKSSVSTPSVTTTAANDALVASYVGYSQGGASTWTPDSGMTELGDASSGGISGSLDTGVQASAGATGSKTATASPAPDEACAVLTALLPAAPADVTPPVISSVGSGSVSSSGASVSWLTDEPADSQVEYGTTTGYGSSSALDAALVTSHSVTLSGLAASTAYHYRVKSRDAAGNLATSGDFTFTTAAPPDVTPPVISSVGSGSVSSSGASVSWLTDEPADSQVEYGTTTGYGSSSALDAALVTSHSVALSGLAASTVYHYRVKSRDAAGNLATSGDFTFTTAAPPGGPVPLIVDTDIFSDADDVGALATAFALQLKGEANVVAIGVNTRTSRPAVATNSWKCVAAVAQFYGFGGVPIGSDMPDNGTATNTPDFVGPCSQLASPSTPAPDTAVNVYRRALVAQANGSVVMVGVGYEENLAALLDSPPDSISPLSGRDLIAEKVKTLVLMGGGYPSRSGENNLIGNPAAAQDVAGNWPTKIVWSGYEVGDAVHTGNTISSTHPANSPVRVAYEAFVGPNNWIYSYDLTAVYHAVRPGDSLLTEVGPGTNVIDNSGGNVFTPGAGNQYYLKLSSATGLDSAIETLLDVLPSAPPDTTPPVISGVAAGSASSVEATVSWNTDEPADSQVEYGTTTAYGSSSTLDPTLVSAHTVTLTGLAASTTYHYRVKSRDAAGNLATSTDYTFTTTAATGANSTTPCVGAAAPSAWRHVVVLMFENQNYDGVIGAADSSGNITAPYITSLAGKCGVSYSGTPGDGPTDNWHNAEYDVLGNYIGPYESKPSYAVLTNGVTPDASGLTTNTYTGTSGVDNIYNQARQAGLDARDYYDGPASTAPCASENFDGAYHDAIRYYNDLGGQSSDPTTYCNTHDQTLSQFWNDLQAGSLPAFSMILPTNAENMHGNSDAATIAAGDAWAADFLTQLLDSPQYQSGDTAVFVLWDEYTAIPNVLIAPSVVRGSRVTPPSGAPVSHYAALRTFEEMLGLPLLGDTAQAPSLLAFFNSCASNSCEPSADTGPPTEPANLRSTAVVYNEVDLAWDASADDVGVTGYHVYRDGNLIATVSGQTTSYADSSVAAGTGYTYTVSAFDAVSNESQLSGPLTVTTPAFTDTTPPVLSAVAAGSVSSSGATVSWNTDEPADSQVEYGTTTAYGSSSTLDPTLVSAHTVTLTGLAASTTYHYRVKSRDAAGNLATSTDYTFTTTAVSAPGVNDTFDSNTIDPATWTVTLDGSTVAAVNQELEITHPATSTWTKGTIQSKVPYDQTGRSIQVQLKRAANDGLSNGSVYGETSIFLCLDASHYAEFFVAGGALTAWYNAGSGDVNLTPSWPRYSATTMQWLRFRESGGTLYWEYASGDTAPGTWTVLASIADPFPLNAVTFKMAAGSLVGSGDTARLDNVSTH